MSLDDRMAHLHDQLAAGRGADPKRGPADLDGALARTRQRVATRHRRRLAALSAAVIVAALGAAGLVRIVTDDDQSVGVTSNEGREGSEPVEGPVSSPPPNRTSSDTGLESSDAWSPVAPGFASGPAGPLAPRSETAMVAVDGVLVVWGGDIEGFNVGRPELGDEAYDDGAVFRPESGWTPMAPSPLPPTGDGPIAVGRGPVDPLLGVDGDAVMTSEARVAAYDPATDAWSSLPALPEVATHLYWTGDTVLAVTDVGGYLLDGDGWSPIATPPDEVVFENAAVAWSGEELFVFSRPPFGGGPELDGYVWDATTDAWSAVPASSLDEGANVSTLTMTWTGSELVVTDGYVMSVAAYDPSSERWRRLPSIPMSSQEGGLDLASIDGLVVAMRPDVVAVLGAEGWLPLLAEPSLSTSFDAVVGDAAYGFGLDYPDGVNALGRFRPSDAVESDRIPVGDLVLELDDGDRIAGAEAEVILGQVVRVHARIETGSGSCDVAVLTSFIGPLVAPPTVDPDGTIRARPSEPSDGPRDVTADGAAVGTIECSDGAEAERIAANLSGQPR